MATPRIILNSVSNTSASVTNNRTQATPTTQWMIAAYTNSSGTGTPVPGTSSGWQTWFEFDSPTVLTCTGLQSDRTYWISGLYKTAQNPPRTKQFNVLKVHTDFKPKKAATPTVNKVTYNNISVNWKLASAQPDAAYNEVALYNSSHSLIQAHDDKNGSPGGWGSQYVSPNTVYYVRTRSHNTYGYGPWSNYRKITSLPDGTNTPTGLSASHVSASRYDLSWTNHATSTRPYDQVQIDRRTDKGSWKRVANLGGSRTSYTDNSLSANRLYEWRVRSKNAAGTSSWSAVSSGVTHPWRPVSVAGARVTAGTAKVTWVNGAFPDAPAATANSLYRTEIQSWDGSSWSHRAWVAGGVTTWTDNNPPSGTTRYRLRPETLSTPGPAGLVSTSWKESNDVVGIAPPFAPTGLAPDGVALDAAEQQTFTWRHNPRDGSAQTKYQVRYREASGPGAWVTGSETASGTSEAVFAADTFDNGTDYEWQVRTWGADDDPGDWSTSAAFVASARPVVGIDAPDPGSYGLSSVTAEWSYSQDQSSPQQAWRAELLDANNGDAQLESLSVSDDSTSAAFDTNLDDGHDYKIRVRVQSAAGLWSDWDTVAISVSYLPPAAVVLDAYYDEASASVVLPLTAGAAHDGVSVAGDAGGPFTVTWGYDGEQPLLEADGDRLTGTDPSVTVAEATAGDGETAEVQTITVDATGGTFVVAGSGDIAFDATAAEVQAALREVAALGAAVDPVSVTIHRAIDGGPWVLVAADLDPDATVIDTRPATWGSNTYRVTVRSAIPSTWVDGEAATVVTDDGRHGWLSTGSGFEVVVPLSLALDFSAKRSRATATHHFAGRALPVEFVGTSRDRSISVSGITSSAEDLRTLQAIVDGDRTVLWRDPVGQRVYGSARALDYSPVKPRRDLWNVSFTVSETDFRE